MRRNFTRDGKAFFKNVETMVRMEQLSSMEYFLNDGKPPRRVLEEINLLIKRAETWAICGCSAFEIKLLLEIAANIKPYHDGRCVLVERGMMRRKRVILEHVFYIGGATMLYDNMNTLEYLMLATARIGFGPVYRQNKLFELLIELGLGHISLTPIKTLLEEEKAVITLLAALYSNSMIIVFNLPEYDFDKVLCRAIGKISAVARERGKTLLIGTKDYHLVEKAATHTAYVTGGKIIYQGTVKNLRLRYDRILLIIKDAQASPLREKLALLLHDYELSLSGECLTISDSGANRTDPLYLYEKIIGEGFAPRHIQINPKTVKNAYEEINRRYDLQKQLFQ